MAAHNKLTQKQIEAAKADGKQSKLADGGGLYLLLHPNGSKYWRMRYRHGGCEKTLALGVYPAVSLKQARELARAARAQTAAGIDPVAEHHRTLPAAGAAFPKSPARGTAAVKGNAPTTHWKATAVHSPT
ncbi:DUF4102 domain-containing protein [Neisseria gonorrhoeae]